MEDHKDELILILAGYQNEMETFMKTNPGLSSRFPIHIEFPDYKAAELLQIAEEMCFKRQYKLTADAKETLLKMLNRPEFPKDETFGNARTVRNMIEKAVRKQAVRLMSMDKTTREELMIITPEDLAEVK